jgi:YhcH/YjgK/YiaL family protein
MIIDSLSNINIYKSLSPDIFLGLEYLTKATSDIELGIYQLSKNVKVIVSEYDTIALFEKGYEAHKHVIDIQYPVIGVERVKWSPINHMSVNIPYDYVNDVVYYKEPFVQGTHVDIGNGIFVIMFPNDGHSPQHYVDTSMKIKKITVKVAIER